MLGYAERTTRERGRIVEKNEKESRMELLNNLLKAQKKVQTKQINGLKSKPGVKKPK